MRLAIHCKKENIEKISKIFNISLLPKRINYDIIIYVRNDNTPMIKDDGQGFCDKFCGNCDICKEKNKFKYDKITDDVSIIRELKLKRII